MKELLLADETATLAFGADIAKQCPARCIIFLQGNLGAGKTTFVRGFLQGLGYTGKVKSPTYTLVEPYEIADKSILHFDLYRLNDPEELEHIGWHDYLAMPAILLIEWPERAERLLPKPDMIISLDIQQDGRKATLQINSPPHPNPLPQGERE